MSWILYCVTLPYTIIVGYGWVLFMRCFAAKDLRFDMGYGILTAEWRDWASARWGYSTTLGRGIIYMPGYRDRIPGDSNRIERHEMVHVRQVEDMMIVSLIIGTTVTAVTFNWILGLIIWFSGGLWTGFGYITAGIRYGFRNMYRDSEYELSAYSQTDLLPNSHHSWLEMRNKIRQ